MLIRRIQFRLSTLLLVIVGIAAVIVAGQVSWRYLRIEAAWRAFPRGGKLEWSESARLLRPQYEIDLSGNPRLRDHHLATFSGLSTIKRIDVSDTPLTDQCLVHFKSLRNLKSIDVTGTEISRRGADELQEALPACTIRRQ